MKRVGGFVVMLAVVFGFRYYNLNDAKKEARKTLTELCANDAPCKQAVDTHFEACFDESSSMGGRRTGPKVDGSKLVGCINQRSGVEHFTYDGSK